MLPSAPETALKPWQNPKSRPASRIKRAVLGARHPDLAHHAVSPARVLGDSRPAAALLRQACDLLSVVPPDQPTLAACRRQLAALQPGSRAYARKPWCHALGI
jgi:hypothetical protein